MDFSKRLAPPIVAAAIATIALTSFATVIVAREHAALDGALFSSIWPMSLTSAVFVMLVMSFLYKAMLTLVTELEKREAVAQHEAVHDQLTGLPNRVLLADRLGQAAGRFRRKGEKFSLLVLDLDRFKRVNDTLGHAAGDLLVRQVAERLRTLLRETDTVARTGGDEFAIVQSLPNGEGDVRRLCERVIEALAAPFQLEEREACVGVSIGAVICDRDIPPQDLVRHADMAMYQAKDEGRNCYRLFSDELDAAAQRRSQLELKLRSALAEGALDLHFQPQLDVAGAVVCVEGLLRWTDPDLGPIAPAEVIPIAEECGLMDELGDTVIELACEAAIIWPHIKVALNLSPLQFRRKDLPARLRDMVLRHGLSCDRIELEITENLLIEHGDLCEAALAELRENGFSIALDDFGTGYSSLSYLRRFAVDKIKLDRAFIEAGDSDQNISIIRAAVMFGHAMNITVVAEGISTAEQEQVAVQAGCDGVQGFRYAPALPKEELTPLLGNWSTNMGARAA